MERKVVKLTPHEYEERFAWQDKHRAAMIRHLLEKPGLLLDVGCATGLFLRLMKENNWSVKGIEPDNSYADSAEQNGVCVLRQPLEELALPDDFFDVITLFHVAEHLENPLACLRKLLTALKKRGY